MSTAALEHLRNWGGQKPLLREKHRKKELRNFMLTECLYAKHVQ